MTRTTQGVDELVRYVLETVPKPYSTNVTEAVFLAIEDGADWMDR